MIKNSNLQIQEAHMEKLLKVCNLPQGSKYASGINLKGQYLNDYGFVVGDFVKVSIKTNEIIITKTDVTCELSNAVKKNQILSKLIDTFDLIPV